MKTIIMLIIATIIFIGCSNENSVGVTDRSPSTTTEELVYQADSLSVAYPEMQKIAQKQMFATDNQVSAFRFTCAGSNTGGGQVLFFGIVDDGINPQYVKMDSLRDNEINNQNINITIPLSYGSAPSYVINYGLQGDLYFGVPEGYIKLSQIKVYTIRNN